MDIARPKAYARIDSFRRHFSVDLRRLIYGVFTKRAPLVLAIVILVWLNRKKTCNHTVFR